MKRIFLLLLAIVLCFLCACSANDTSIDTDAQEITVPNNGEWDEILCSGDSYHLVKKEVDAYDGYKFMLGIVNDAGEWVQELTDTGTFVENVRFRAEGSSEIYGITLAISIWERAFSWRPLVFPFFRLQGIIASALGKIRLVSSILMAGNAFSGMLLIIYSSSVTQRK